MSDPSKPIGIFDSGAGGLAVVRHFIQLLPHESFYYFGDTAHLPYGEKSAEAITHYATKNAVFLEEKGIKILIIACNTVSAYATEKLKTVLNIPVVHMIELGAKQAVENSKSQRIAILGTKATILSKKYQQEIQQRSTTAKIFPIACPLLVPIVEENFIHHPAAKLIVKEYLDPIKEENIDTLILGCSHYSFLSEIIQQEIGTHVTLVDPAQACVCKTAEILKQNTLKADNSHTPSYEYFVSAQPEKFRLLAQKLLKMPNLSVSLDPPHFFEHREQTSQHKYPRNCE